MSTVDTTGTLRLEDLGVAFRPVGNAEQAGLSAPEPQLDVALRTSVRALAGMQKEALVYSGASGQAWRLTCDEGDYLAGTDLAPPPLGFFSVGMCAAYVTELLALAADRGVRLDDLRVTVDNYYSMDGSALRGTLTGGAYPAEVTVEAGTDLGRQALHELVRDAVAASAVQGLLRGVHTSLFTLTHNGEQVDTARVASMTDPAFPDPAPVFAEVALAESPLDNVMVKVAEDEQHGNAASGEDTSLQAQQSRRLHARAVCAVREDGVKMLDQYLFSPVGSRFRFLCEEATSAGGRGRAPDAATYIAAAIGLCFMTQLGRYAKITKKPLDEYTIVQDSHFSAGAASGLTGRPGQALPLETHTHLHTAEPAESARQMLDIAEQTCFLHALCRTDLTANVSVAGNGVAGA